MVETLDSSTYEHTDPQPISSLNRNADPLTLRLRSKGPVGIDELINLYRTTSPIPVESSSSGTRTPTAFSSRKESTATKPTSAGTGYPFEGYTGKGKATATYASSLCATQGSASEAEAEVDATRDNALLGVGHWMVESFIAAPPLKGSARARKRQRVNSRPKQKKPPVVIFQHQGIACASSDGRCPTVAKPEDRRNSKDVKYLRRRRSEPEHNDQLPLAEEGCFSAASTLALPSGPLSRARFFIIISLVIAIFLTFALSAFAVHHTGKMRMACTKGIIFAASVLMSCFTVFAMIVARHTLQTALLAGLLEFLVGFALVVEVHEFMA